MAISDSTHARKLKHNDLIWDNTANLRQLLESAPLAIVTIDQAGHILYVNARLEELLGFQRQELIGQAVETLLPERFRTVHLNHRAEYTAQPRVRAMGSSLDLVAQTKDGTEIPIEVGLSYVEIQDELLIMGSVVDISLRKQAETHLEQRVEDRTQEIERRRRVTDSLRDILTLLNSNQPLEKILNYMVGQASSLFQANACAIYQLKDGVGPLSIQASRGLTAEYLDKDQTASGHYLTSQAAMTREILTVSDLATIYAKGNPESKAQWRHLRESGFAALLVVPLLVKDETYGAMVLYYNCPRDFSSQDHELVTTFADQAALAIENAWLRRQVERAAVVAERSRLARDLHDSVTQTLFSASLIAEVMPRLWKRNTEEAERRLEELRLLTRGALAEMRTLLLELRPSRLTEVELGDLLRQLAEAITGRARVPVILEIEGDCDLPPDVQVSLYRTAQEALNNVAKHARAKHTTVSLRCEPEQVRLSISDNGSGFILESITPQNLGLSIMQERADAIGAELEINTKLGRGTNVVVTWRYEQDLPESGHSLSTTFEQGQTDG